MKLTDFIHATAPFCSWSKPTAEFVIDRLIFIGIMDVDELINKIRDKQLNRLLQKRKMVTFTENELNTMQRYENSLRK
jgi:hypothetical protein